MIAFLELREELEGWNSAQLTKLQMDDEQLVASSLELYRTELGAAAFSDLKLAMFQASCGTDLEKVCACIGNQLNDIQLDAYDAYWRERMRSAAAVPPAYVSSSAGAVKLLASAAPCGEPSEVSIASAKPSEVSIASLFSGDAGDLRIVDLAPECGKALMLHGVRAPPSLAHPPP